jgi:tetratricopeptide (TPR) repeat protein
MLSTALPRIMRSARNRRSPCSRGQAVLWRSVLLVVGLLALAAPAAADDQATCSAGGYDAIAACSRLIVADPFIAWRTYNNRGIAYNNQGDYDRAIADYTEAIRLDPKYAGAFSNRGTAYRNKGDNGRAIADYTEALRLNPNLTAAAEAKAAMVAKAEADAKAAAQAKAAAEAKAAMVAKAEADAKAAAQAKAAAEAKVAADRAACGTRDGDGAIAACGRMIALDPNDAVAFNNRGFAYVGKSDYDRAIADYSEAIRLDPKLTAAADAKATLVAKVAAEKKAAAARKAALEESRKRHFNSIAIVIGNSDYRSAAPVKFAGNDAKAIKDYLVATLGFREENVFVMLNLGREDMDRLFGNPTGDNGVMALVNQRRKERRGDVFVYYSGHGVPNPRATTEEEKQAYLLPIDVAPDRGPVAGIPLRGLQDTLENIRHELPSDRTVVLMLDTCFGGRLFASSGAMSAPVPSVSAGFVRLIGATGDELAYWNETKGLGLFTSLFLDAVSGAADGEGFGDQNGRVEGGELRITCAIACPPRRCAPTAAGSGRSSTGSKASCGHQWRARRPRRDKRANRRPPRLVPFAAAHESAVVKGFG